MEKIKIRSKRFLFDFSFTKMYVMISIDNQNSICFSTYRCTGDRVLVRKLRQRFLCFLSPLTWDFMGETIILVM